MGGDGIFRDATGDALRRLRDDGSDLEKPMAIDFHVAVPSDDAGKKVAEAATRLGYDAKLWYDDEKRAWTCWCTKTMLAEHAAITRAEQELDRLSAPFEGHVDGWGSFGNKEEPA